MPKEELLSLGEKLKLLKSLIAPIILVFLVLGLLFGGIATPVEAAGLGSFGAIIVAIIQRKFSLLVLKEASLTTLRASTMVLWIMFGASIFVGFYILQGGQAFITETMLGLGLGPTASSS
jgi:TRAP-type mannitol/chloroaromatic compound transport system permease large subunit